MFKNNKNLLIIALIAVVNALGYGIIIPILYSYSQRFGLSDFQNGLLFSIFSIGQFVATPVIGRLSDKYGRKPLLIISIIGTAVSFLMMAFARSAMWLFLARALDGITAGNIPVASAVISDTTKPQERAKGFGIIGASFGFGFIFGPAISALTVRINLSLTFLIDAAISILAVILTWVILPETNQHMGQVVHKKLFDLGKLIRSIFDEQVGATLAISLLYSLAISIFIYAYQPFSVKILHLSATEISINFTIFGLVGLVAQTLFIPRAIKMWGERKTLVMALSLAIFTFLILFSVRSALLFAVVSIFHALANAFINPLTQALLSKEVDAKSQGTIMGISASYMSMGMILGPVIGGVVATYSIPMPFLAGSFTTVICFWLSLQILKKPLTHKISEF